MQKKHTPLVICQLIILAVVAACGPSELEEVPRDPEKDKIVIGQVVSLSGPQAESVELSSGPVYDMWIEDVNKEGGIYVEEYDKKLPVELIKYDDKSDINTMKEKLQEIITEDKVDFLLPPWGTTFLYEAAAIANEHEHILIGGAGGAIELKEAVSELPYFFSTLNHAYTQAPALVDILEELNVGSAAIFFARDLHGIEYSGTLVPKLLEREIETKVLEGFQPDREDFSSFLHKASELDVDAFLFFGYPEWTLPVTQQALEQNYNFDVFFLSVGPNFSIFRDTLGEEAAEGIMGAGAWNKKSYSGAEKFYNKYKDFYGEDPDYWGALVYYSSLQHFRKAIEEAGTLEQSEIRDVLATETYNTYIGEFSYQDGFFRGHLGEIGQWQSGVFEVIGPGENRTADPVIKPEWP